MPNEIQTTILTRGDSTEAEDDLFRYAGYYIYDKTYHGMDDVTMYVPTDKDGYGYHFRKRSIFPGAMNLITKPDMDKAIVFDTKNTTVSTGNMPMDLEMLEIIQRRAEELGFDYPDQDGRLIHKLRKIKKTGRFDELKPEDFGNMMELLLRLYEERK